MTPKELKILFIQKDLLQKHICQESGTCPATVYQICAGHSRSKRIEEIIARRLNLKRGDIFPLEPEPMRSRSDEKAA